MTLRERLNIAGKAVVGIFNENSLKAAHGLLSGVLPGGYGIPPTRGTADYLRAYSQMPWLRAVTGRVSTAVACAEWQLFVVKGKNDRRARRDRQIQRAEKSHRKELLKAAEEKEELTQITDHPMLDVLHNANEFQTGFAMRKISQLHLDLVGDAFWLKERDALGTIVGVWPIPPNWILSTPTPNFRFFRVSFRAWRGNIPDTEFIWFTDPDPLNPYGRGSGSAMALGDELDTDEYAARHTRAFFYNNARPDLLIWPKGQVGINDSNIKRLEEDWMSKNQGFFRTFKPYFMTREVEVKELEQNFRALQLVQLREFERDTILQHYGIPPEILGVLANSNRATIDAADYFMSRYVTEPRLESMRQVLQERMVPEYDERLIIDYVSPIQEDTERYLEAMKTAPWAPTVDEWRKAQGLGPLEDKEAGKLHMVPFGSEPKPIEYDPYTPPPVPAPGAPPVPGTEPPEDPQPTAPGEGRRGIALGGVGRALDFRDDLEAAVDAEDYELQASLGRAWAKGSPPPPSEIAAKHEPAMLRALVRVWREASTRVDTARLAQAIAQSNIDEILLLIDSNGVSATLIAAAKPILVRSTLSGVEIGGRSLRTYGVSVRGLDEPTNKRDPRLSVDMAAVNPLVTAWANEHAGALVQASADIRAHIAQLVARANEQGIPPHKLANLIRNVIGLTERQVEAVEKFHDKLVASNVAEEKINRRVERYANAQRKSRALTISRTETIASVNAGQQMLWKQALKDRAIKEEEFEKVWIVTEDDLLDTVICEPLSDARTEINGAFAEGIEHPPAHPNCLVNANTPIYTVGGWKRVKDVEVGDQVLSHKGRFQPVTHLHRNKSAEPTVRLWIHNRRHKLSLTSNHPVLMADGRWVEAAKIAVGDKVVMIGRSCAYCGKTALGEYCGNSCATIGAKKWLKANDGCRRRVLDGVFVLQKPETKVLANKKLAKEHASGSWLERKVRWSLEQLGLKPERYHPIPQMTLDKLGRRRNWFVDFAFPDLKIAIECDGEHWHKNFDRDARRQDELEAQGWTVLRFTGAEIKADLLGCAERVARVANNHAKGYVFGGFEVVAVEIIERKQAYATYNLSVAQDESFVAKGVVVHNCRCAVGLVPKEKKMRSDLDRLVDVVERLTAPRVIERDGEGRIIGFSVRREEQ